MCEEGFGEVGGKMRRSTARVSAGSGGQGSGGIVRPDGTVVTNVTSARVARFGRLAAPAAA
jgi:hypothetical protein